MKTCACCLIEKPRAEFGVERRASGGLRARCKPCHNARRRELRFLNPEPYRAHTRASAAKRRADRLDEVRAYMRAWSVANPDKVAKYRANASPRDVEQERARQRAWAEKNREKMVARSRRWQQRNPEKVVAYVARRDALKRQAYAAWGRELTDLVAIEAAHLAKLRERQLGFKWHVDHAIPIRGEVVCGLHVWNNLQVIPAVLNISKSNKFEVSA